MNASRYPDLRSSALLVAGVAAAYGALLGWDQTKDVKASTGELTGPYQAWQVVSLIVILLGLGAWAASRRDPQLVFVVPAGLVLCWSVDLFAGGVDDDGQGLWPVGLLFLVIASFAVAALLLALHQPLQQLAHASTRGAWLEDRWRRAHRRGLVTTLARAAAAGAALGWCAAMWNGAYPRGLYVGAAVAVFVEAALYLAGQSTASGSTPPTRSTPSEQQTR